MSSGYAKAKGVLVEPGCDLVNRSDDKGKGIAAAVAAAEAADRVILAVGTGLRVIDEGADLQSLQLPGSQPDLIKAVVEACAAKHKPLVIVLVMGNQMAVDP